MNTNKKRTPAQQLLRLGGIVLGQRHGNGTVVCHINVRIERILFLAILLKCEKNKNSQSYARSNEIRHFFEPLRLGQRVLSEIHINPTFQRKTRLARSPANELRASKGAKNIRPKHILTEACRRLIHGDCHGIGRRMSFGRKQHGNAYCQSLLTIRAYRISLNQC